MYILCQISSARQLLEWKGAIFAHVQRLASREQMHRELILVH